jgi:hypothetical protein
VPVASILGVFVFGLQEQQDQFPLQKVLKVAATEREFGNHLFRQNRFYDAKVRYKRVRMLDGQVEAQSLRFPA